MHHFSICNFCISRLLYSSIFQDTILQSTGRGRSVTVTNDGATILKSLHIGNPAAKVLVGILIVCFLGSSQSYYVANSTRFFPCTTFCCGVLCVLMNMLLRICDLFGALIINDIIKQLCQGINLTMAYGIVPLIPSYRHLKSSG